MEALRKKYIKKAKKTGIICFVIGILLVLFVFQDWLPIGSSTDLNYVSSVNQIQEGRASIDVLDIFDYFMYYNEGYSTSDEEAVAREYFVGCGTALREGELTHPVFIPVYLEGKDNDKAMQLLTAYWGENDSFDFNDESNYLKIKGHIKPLEGDELKYYQNFLIELSKIEEISLDVLDTYFSPYILYPNELALVREAGYLSITILILSALLLVVGVYFFIKGLGNPLKDIELYAKQHLGIEDAKLKAQNLIDNCNPKYGMRADEDMFLYDDGSKLFVADAKDVIWAHEHMVTRKSGFVTVGRDYFVKIYMADGRVISRMCAKQDDVPYVLSALESFCPDIILGYSDERQRIYKKNRQDMINEVNKRRFERLNRNTPQENVQGSDDMSMNMDFADGGKNE